MSVTNSIDISIKFEGSKVALIKMFFENGWTPNDNGKVTYLPLGDVDEFDWFTKKLKLDEIYEILVQKETNSELLGIVMTWEDSMIGGQLLIFNDRSMSFIPSINPRFIDTCRVHEILDYNWYIDKLVQPLCKLDILINSIKIERT